MVSNIDQIVLLSLIKDNARLLYGPGYTYYIATCCDNTKTAQAKLFGYNVSGIGGQVLRVGNAPEYDIDKTLRALHENMMSQVSVLTGRSTDC